MKQQKSTGWYRKIREFIIRPEFFLFVGFIYIVVSTLAAMDPAMQALNDKVAITPTTFLVFFFGLACFNLGLKTAKVALRLKFIPLSVGILIGTMAAHFILGQDFLTAFLFNITVVVTALILLYSKMKYEYLFTGGFFLFVLNFTLVGIPLLDPTLHVELFDVVNALFIFGFFFMLYSLVRMYPKRRYLWVVLIALTMLSTYRIYMGIAVITWLLLELQNFKKPNIKRFLPILIVGIIAIGAFIYIGHVSKLANSGNWILNPVGTVEYRLALTIGVFNDVVKLAFPYGYTFGQSIQMEATEFNCRVLYGCIDRITATAFGQAMLDFGLIGVFLVAWWMAVVLGNLYRHDYPLYAMLFATLLAVIDVGINIFVIIEFIYLGWLGLIGQWKVKKVYTKEA